MLLIIFIIIKIKVEKRTMILLNFCMNQQIDRNQFEDESKANLKLNLSQYQKIKESADKKTSLKKKTKINCKFDECPKKLYIQHQLYTNFKAKTQMVPQIKSQLNNQQKTVNVKFIYQSNTTLDVEQQNNCHQKFHQNELKKKLSAPQIKYHLLHKQDKSQSDQLLDKCPSKNRLIDTIQKFDDMSIKNVMSIDEERSDNESIVEDFDQSLLFGQYKQTSYKF